MQLLSEFIFHHFYHLSFSIYFICVTMTAICLPAIYIFQPVLIIALPMLGISSFCYTLILYLNFLRLSHPNQQKLGLFNALILVDAILLRLSQLNQFNLASASARAPRLQNLHLWTFGKWCCSSETPQGLSWMNNISHVPRCLFALFCPVPKSTTNQFQISDLH